MPSPHACIMLPSRMSALTANATKTTHEYLTRAERRAAHRVISIQWGCAIVTNEHRMLIHQLFTMQIRRSPAIGRRAGTSSGTIVTCRKISAFAMLIEHITCVYM
jgi:hypothetical protein